MLRWLRRHHVRHFVLAAMLATFLPMAVGSVACQILCDLQDVGTFSAHHPEERDSPREATAHPGSHLQHPGPCHLAMVPSVWGPTDVELAVPSAHVFEPGQHRFPASFTGAPPEHKPRISHSVQTACVRSA